jgi:hypothetical protein
MISDTLFEARLEIEHYLTDYPETYGELRGEIEAVCTAMARLQAKLDNPFFHLDTPMPEGANEV